MMEQLLRQAGHEVWGADDAETAGRAMRDREFDVAVIELVLAGDMSGTEFLEWLRDFPPPGDPARIALCSLASFASQEAYLRAELQLDAFLLKPFTPSAFRQIVEKALQARAARPRRGARAPEPEPEAELELSSDDLIPLETNPGSPPRRRRAPWSSRPRRVRTRSRSATCRLLPPPSGARRRATRCACRSPSTTGSRRSGRAARTSRAGGGFVSTERAYPQGTKLRVRLDLPVAGQGFNEILAEVVHARPSAPWAASACASSR